ncbi:uncharacterized protein ACNS7B_021191 [Menidia menidia]
MLCLQGERESWPVFYKHLYKTSNNAYGSTLGSQNPFDCSLPPVFPPFGPLNPSFPHSVGGACFTLNDPGTHGANFPRETGPSICEKDKAVAVLNQHDSKADPRWKTDVRYEEGVILLSPCSGLACCEDFLRSLHGEVRPQQPLNSPVASCPIVTSIHNKDADSLENSVYLWGLSPALGQSDTSQQHGRQCSYCAWEAEHPAGGCPHMRPIPAHMCRSSSSQPPANAQGQSLTEYRASYSSEWDQPKIQQVYHHLPPCHRSPHPSL